LFVNQQNEGVCKLLLKQLFVYKLLREDFCNQ